MNILPVNGQSNMNFGGIWGTARVRSSYSKSLNTQVLIRKSYYPFKDEAIGAIDDAIREASITLIPNLERGLPGIIRTEAQCKNRLPFTESEYNDYCQSKLDQPQRKNIIEETLESLGLCRLLNKQ